MSNALTHNMGGQVPAHVLAAFGKPANSDLAANVAASYPIISYKGKVWHVVEGGERTLVTVGEGRNANDPAASLEAVIIRANPALNKVYYPDGYEEGSTERPLCHSDDGVLPSPDAQEQQSKACGACPHNEWGSKISDNGSRGKACADSRRMAVASIHDLENPMLLRCPAASLKTLLAFSQQLDKRGWPYQALVTRIGFDAGLAYPSLTFTPERWLEPGEVAQVMAMQDDDLVLQITALHTRTAPAAATPQAEPSDAFSRMEQTMPGAAQPVAEPEPAPQPAVAATRKRKPKGVATPEEVQQVVEAAQPQPAAPAKRGFGAPRPAPVQEAVQETVAAQPEPAQTNGLGASALAELEDVLAGFDDGDSD